MASMAFSTSASSQTMHGHCPPSSSVTRLMPSAAAFITDTPPATLPVSAALRTNGCRTSASPTLLPPPVITLNTPGGNPISLAICATSGAVSGVSDDGLATTVHPAAKAGPIMRLSRCKGSFHGGIAATTPIGWRST